MPWRLPMTVYSKCVFITLLSKNKANIVAKKDKRIEV
jgi:hypothetical protein